MLHSVQGVYRGLGSLCRVFLDQARLCGVSGFALSKIPSTAAV